MKTSATAFAPASVSNVSCGFDIMGFALDRPGDEVTVRAGRHPGVKITSITGNADGLPFEPERNTAGPPVIALLQHLGIREGVEIEIVKGLAVGSGLGSSAASAVAAAMACNALLEAGLSAAELLPFALEGEKIASGAEHVDNLAPCLLGGFILVRGYHPLDIVPIRVPKELWCAIIHPHVEIRTKESRKLLPAAVPLADVVTQTGNSAGLIAGLLTGDYALIGRCLSDAIAEPVRAGMIPGFTEMKAAAMSAGALGCGISGSGPAVFALATSRETGRAIENAMGSALGGLRCSYTTHLSGMNCQGARLVGPHSS